MKAASKEKHPALRLNRRRLRSVDLRPRALGALRGLAMSLRRLQKSIPLDAFGTRGSGEGSLRGSACGGSGLRPSFPPPASPAPFALPAATPTAYTSKTPPNTARDDATLPGIVFTGAPTLLSGMLA